MSKPRPHRLYYQHLVDLFEVAETRQIAHIHPSRQIQMGRHRTRQTCHQIGGSAKFCVSSPSPSVFLCFVVSSFSDAGFRAVSVTFPLVTFP
jgi:hypothetical protein